MSFFVELKRRNVFRVAVAYGVAAWVILQIVDLVLDNVEAPDWVMDVFMLVVVLGFLVSVVIAWAYEITPEGIKRESEIDRDRSITGQTGKKLDRVIILFLVLAVAVLLVERTRSPSQLAETAPVTTTEESPGFEVPELTAEPSIAVLPFVNMSADPEQEYFSDGISEELLNLLVRVEGLDVASRTSSFTYKGENLDIPEIASELKVDHILEGSVRKAGNRVRITAQLIDVTTDRHLWSDTFDRELTDIFAIQDEIANAIVNALKNELGIGLESVSVETATENLDAYDLYLKARGLFIARRNLAHSIELFERATLLDPEFALAWEGLAAAHSVSASWLTGDGVDHTQLAFDAAHKALEINPNLSMAHAVIGIHHANLRNYIEGLLSLDRAIESDPKNATAWLWRGISFKDLGYLEQAVADFQSCLDIDSDYQNCKQHAAEALLCWGRVEEAISLLEETIEANFHSTTDSFVSHYVKQGHRITALLLASLALNRDYTPADIWVAAIENPSEDHSSRVAQAGLYASQNNMSICDLGGMIVALKQYQCMETYDGIRMVWHPDAAEYRQSSSFKDFAGQTMLPYWQLNGFPPQCRDLGEGDFECD